MTYAHGMLQQYLARLQIGRERIDDIVRCFTITPYQKQTHFSRIGDHDDKLAFLISGIFCMYLTQEDGTLFVKDFLHLPQFFTATFAPRQASMVNLQALNDALVLEASYAEIQQIFARDRELETLAKQGLEQRLTSLYNRLEAFATMDATTRYLRFKKDYGEVEADIPQHLIAAYIGITPTQLSRIRKKYTNLRLSQQM